MPVDRRLIENRRILYIKFSEPWTVEETFSLIERQKVFTKADGQHIHLLIDLTEMLRFPSDMLRLREAPAFALPRASRTIVISANSLGQHIFEVFEQLHDVRFEYFSSYDDGLAYLRAVIAVEDVQNGIAAQLPPSG